MSAMIAFVNAGNCEPAFDAARFSINTDIEGLISEDLPWHQRQIALSKAFPQKGIIAVVKAPSAENAEQATNALVPALSRQPDLFPLVERHQVLGRQA
jgi:hypothetical protein